MLNNPMDHRQIYGDASVQPQITAMVARQGYFNACVNLLMSAKMWYLHHIHDGGPRNVHGPQLGFIFNFFPVVLVKYLCAVSMP
jgi:hypothetical protein